MDLEAWRAKWNIPDAALKELAELATVRTDDGSQTEAGVMSRARQRLSRQGVVIMRNNVGVCQDSTGRYIRYGLANESKKVNESIKSSDLIGIEPVQVVQEMVGGVIGRFVAYECKHPGWKYTGTDREKAQLAFLKIIASKGGTGRFIS